MDIQNRIRSILNGEDEDEVMEQPVDDVIEETVDQEEPEAAPVEEQVQAAVSTPESSMSNVSAVKKNPMPVTVPKIKASDFRKKKDGTSKSKKAEINLDEIAKQLDENFEKMGAEARLEAITRLICTSPSGLAKVFGWTPGNRILQSVRGERPLSQEAAEAVCSYVKANENISSRSSLSSKITASCFVTPKKAKPKAATAPVAPMTPTVAQ